MGPKNRDENWARLNNYGTNMVKDLQEIFKYLNERWGRDENGYIIQHILEHDNLIFS